MKRPSPNRWRNGSPKVKVLGVGVHARSSGPSADRTRTVLDWVLPQVARKGGVPQG